MKPKLKSIRVYEDTLDEIRKFVSDDPRQTISGFYDKAAKEKLKNIINEQNARFTTRRPDNSESPEVEGR